MEEDYYEVLAKYLGSLYTKQNIRELHSDFKEEPVHYSLHEWIERVYMDSYVSPSCIVQGCILLQKIHKNYPTLQFSEVFFFFLMKTVF
jgi:disulfide oxidoreductase YuzD